MYLHPELWSTLCIRAYFSSANRRVNSPVGLICLITCITTLLLICFLTHIHAPLQTSIGEIWGLPFLAPWCPSHPIWLVHSSSKSNSPKWAGCWHRYAGAIETWQTDGKRNLALSQSTSSSVDHARCITYKDQGQSNLKPGNQAATLRSDSTFHS